MNKLRCHKCRKLVKKEYCAEIGYLTGKMGFFIEKDGSIILKDNYNSCTKIFRVICIGCSYKELKECIKILEDA